LCHDLVSGIGFQAEFGRGVGPQANEPLFLISNASKKQVIQKNIQE
jgi:hypothetical protein